MSEKVADMLLAVMEQESEARWCAGWMTDIEYELWEEDEFRDMGVLAGGWWIWRAGGTEFIPLKKWRAMVAARSENLGNGESK